VAAVGSAAQPAALTVPLPSAVWPAPLTAGARVMQQAPRATPDVVQVRIGRIEVRAAISPPNGSAAKPARVPRPRPLALEAFLEGKRRR
jgi:hypothetical protein